jgi:hypothetical protein
MNCTRYLRNSPAAEAKSKNAVTSHAASGRAACANAAASVTRTSPAPPCADRAHQRGPTEQRRRVAGLPARGTGHHDAGQIAEQVRQCRAAGPRDPLRPVQEARGTPQPELLDGRMDRCRQFRFADGVEHEVMRRQPRCLPGRGVLDQPLHHRAGRFRQVVAPQHRADGNQAGMRCVETRRQRQRPAQTGLRPRQVAKLGVRVRRGRCSADHTQPPALARRSRQAAPASFGPCACGVGTTADWVDAGLSHHVKNGRRRAPWPH